MSKPWTGYCPADRGLGTAPALPWDILAVSINHDRSGATLSTASIQLINDYWIRNLSPADLTELATQGHALLDALTHAARSTAHTSKLELAGIRFPITSDHEPTREREILASTIHYIPATNNEPPTAFTSIHIIEDAWIPNLTPTTLTDFTTQARAYFDMLTHALRPALTSTDKPTTPNP